MSRQKQIEQESTKYPWESARPTVAEEEGLQAAGGGGGGGGTGSRRKDRRVPFHRSRSWTKPSQACLCKSREKVMMPVRLIDR